MYTKPIVLPLTDDGCLYGLFDEYGRQIASGSREACGTLFYLLTSSQLLNELPEMARGRANSSVSSDTAVVG